MLWWDGSLTVNDLTTNCTVNKQWSSFKPNGFLSAYMVGLKAITLSSITNHREKEGRKEGNVLRCTQHILFTVIWHQTYDKGPHR